MLSESKLKAYSKSIVYIFGILELKGSNVVQLHKQLYSRKYSNSFISKNVLECPSYSD